MASQPISALTQFSPAGRMLIPLVDPAAGPGLKNGVVLLSALLAMLGGASEGATIWSGAVTPPSSTGNNGDFYFEITSNSVTFWGPKTGGEWPSSGVSLNGAVGAPGTNGTNGSNANLATLPDESTLALTDFIAAVISGVPAQIEVSNFLAAVGMNVSALSAAAAAGATDTVVTLQSGTAVLQTLAAMWTYFATLVPAVRTGVIELTANIVLDGSVHNSKILICSQPVTISAPVTFLGSGLTCQIINISSGVVTLGSGILTSSGAQTIPAGQAAELTSYTYSGGNGYFANISGGAGALTGAGLSVGTVASSYPVGAAIAVVGSVGPSGTAVQVAIGNSATTAPSTGWTSATVSGTGFTASITEGTAGTYYVWARQTANTAVQAVSGAVTVAATSVGITAAPSSGSTGFALSASGTVSPSGTAVQIGLSSSATTPPNSWTAATVTSGTWTGSITPSAAGTFYLWAEQTGNSAITAVSGAITITASAVTITSPPSTGTVGTALNLAGTLAPSGSAVNVGLSTSATVAPTIWTAATVSGTGWTASLTPATAGTFYLWAELTADTAVTAVSGAVTIGAAGGGALTFSLVAGSGSAASTGGALVGNAMTYISSGGTAGANFTSAIPVGATNVTPNVQLASGVSALASVKFWYDSSPTNITLPGVYGNSVGVVYSSTILFYAFNSGNGTPVDIPAAPATAGTYYGTFALYDGSGNLLGVYKTSAITVS